MKKILTTIISLLFIFVSVNAFASDVTTADAKAKSKSYSTSGAIAATQSKTDLSNANIGNDNSSNSVVYEAQKIPVATAYAPALTTSNDTCMGSTSAGAQGLLIGISFGTTWTDADCVTRKDARFVHNAGHRIVALSLMCGKEAVRAAVARAGTPEQMAACSITELEMKDYREKPVIVEVDRVAPSIDEFDEL